MLSFHSRGTLQKDWLNNKFMRLEPTVIFHKEVKLIMNDPIY